MKKLPIGDQTFIELIKPDTVYVDKTEYIYNLVKPRRGRYFFSRPRRFGKSLTCSTLDTIFSGNKELFKDLWIYQSDYEWEARPVVRFDFSQISHGTVEELTKGLHSALNFNAEKHGIKLTEQTLKEKFAQLITMLGRAKGQVAIIIDEYDKPITDVIDNPDMVDLMRIELRNFYGTLKGDTVDANMYFLFITGVSKFSKVALFSEFNNLDDITLDERYAALVGYTQRDVEAYLAPHIMQLAEKEQSTYDQILSKLKDWYNGFRFSKSKITVYNPFSMHKCLSSKDFSNYWFTSGTPRFLIKIFTKEPSAVKEFVDQSSWEIAASGMETFSPEVYYKNIVPLLLQTGYLTIESYNNLARNYTLDYPNHEVRYSMTEQIMEFVAKIPDVIIGKLMERFTRALQADDINAYCVAFRDYLKQIPHDIIVSREKFFQATFVGTALLVDVNAVIAEVATDRGFVDVVLHGANKVFVIEFKLNETPKVAFEQIITKKYHEKYIAQGESVTLVGINVDTQNGVEVAWITSDQNNLPQNLTTNYTVNKYP